MSVASRQGIGIVAEVAILIFLVAIAAYLLAPTLSFDWPKIDQQAITEVARSMVVFLAAEALGFWLILGILFHVIGGIRRTESPIRFLPHVSCVLFISKISLVFHKDTFDWLFQFTSWSCIPECVEGDQFCFVDSIICFDRSGFAIFAIFRLLPFALMMAYFIGLGRSQKTTIEVFR